MKIADVKKMEPGTALAVVRRRTATSAYARDGITDFARRTAERAEVVKVEQTDLGYGRKGNAALLRFAEGGAGWYLGPAIIGPWEPFEAHRAAEKAEHKRRQAEYTATRHRLESALGTFGVGRRNDTTIVLTADEAESIVEKIQALRALSRV